MPRGDRTGPNGMGPLTGRQMGFCAGYDQPGFRTVAPGFRRRGRGFGWGRYRGAGYGGGYRYGVTGDVAPVSQKTLLENEIRILKDQLSNLEKELDEISKEK